MTQRQEGLQDLAEAMHVSRDIYQRIRTLVIRRLSSNQQRIYELVEQIGEVSTREIADKCGWSINYVSNELKALWELGLLERWVVRDENGRQFVYRVKP